MNIKLILLFLFSFGVINASDPLSIQRAFFGFGPPGFTGLLVSSGKAIYNVCNDNKVQIACSMVNNAIQYEEKKIYHDAEKAGLIAENTELKNHIKILRDTVEMNSKAMINAYERLEKSKKFNDELFKHIEEQDKQYKEALEAKKAVDSLGKVQLHILAAYEQSENRAGYFTERHNRFNQNTV